MSAYDIKTTGNFSDEILEPLNEIYSKQKQRYPIHDPVFLRARADFLRCCQKTQRPRCLVFLKRGRLLGYLPYLESGVFHKVPILKTRLISLPIQLVDGNYSVLFRLLLKKILRPEETSYFLFNFTDMNRDLETRVLAAHGCAKENFVTHVNRDWKRSKEIRYYVKRSIDSGCRLDDKLTPESFTEYYRTCMYESRTRKGVELNGSAKDFVGLYSFFERLVKLDRGRMSFVKDENDRVVGGIFIVYNNQICVYFHAATSIEGLKKYAGYLNLNGAIEFCQQRGLIFDLFGTYKNSDRNYQNLYTFKRKWGEEFDVAEYRHYPFYRRMAKIVATRNKGRL
jgi:hypothetical protein